jgi:membrane-associated PAP2 superfamily phosphatase
MSAGRTPPLAGRARSFWLFHLWLPAALFVAAATTIRALDLDRRVAAAWFFDASTGDWIGAGTWWAVDLLHGSGSALVVAVGLAGFGVAVGGSFAPRLRPYRRKAGFLVASMVLLALVAGMLKQVTQMDCPRDIVGFGGSNPFLRLFEHRPDGLAPAACFPGSHSSTGFSLMAFYFMFLDTRPRLALPVGRPHQRRPGLVPAPAPLASVAKILRGRPVAIGFSASQRPTIGYERAAPAGT